jgi:hypothetical protein
LVENRLKQWTVKYGREEHVKTLLDQYNNFVNRNKIFQEFDRAVTNHAYIIQVNILQNRFQNKYFAWVILLQYIDMSHVIDEYKREGGIGKQLGKKSTITTITRKGSHN